MATPGDTIAPAMTANQVRADIERQLKPQLSHGGHAVVDTIALAYYDNNADYLQPVYRFEATVTPQNSEVSPIRVAGYVAIGTPREAIPDLAKPSGQGPGSPRNPGLTAGVKLSPEQDSALRREFGGAGTPQDFTLGEYANQDWPNNGAYVDMSNTFLAGLQSRTSAVNRTQWYVAYPWEVVGPSSKYFLNAVNVAYTVPHGDWLLNTTESNCCDEWHVQDIGTNGNPGFGAAAGGVLATWVIMSCEVVPSMYDRQNEINGTGNPYTAFDAWWPVFQGLHNVIGFRTEMIYPDDNLQWGFGQDAAMGGDINAAWFQEVAVDSNGATTYQSQHLKGNPQVHWDRASTMIDARDLGQSIYNIAPQSASTTLWNFWMGN